MCAVCVCGVGKGGCMSPFLPGLIGAPLMPSCAPRMTAGRQGVTVSGCDKWGGVADDPPFAGRAAGFESGRLEGPSLHGLDGIGDWVFDSWGDGRSSGGNSTEVRGGGSVSGDAPCGRSRFLAF